MNPVPGRAALPRVAGLGIVRRSDQRSPRREVVLAPPADLVPGIGNGAGELLDPHCPQHGQGRHFAQPSRRGAGMRGFEELISVGGDLLSEPISLGPVGSQTVSVGPCPVTLLPRRIHPAHKPVRDRNGQRFQ